MPSRYCLTASPEDVHALFRYHQIQNFPPRTNIRPTEPAIVVRTDHRRRREAALVRWGLIPPWIKEHAITDLGTMATARAETIVEKPSFRGAIRHKRCLVPADGFVVWSGQSGSKTPQLARLGQGELMAFAAIYEEWLGANGSEIDSMAIITRPATEPVSRFAPRMPALVHRDDFAAWLDCTSGRAVEALQLLDRTQNISFEVVEDRTA